MKDIVLIGPMLSKPPDLARFHGMLRVAVDGGIRYAPTPDLWVGDGDSGAKPVHIPAFFKESQNETDFSYCLKIVREKKPQALHLFGFLGGRRAQEMAVIGEVAQEMRTVDFLTTAHFYTDDGKEECRVMRAGRHDVDFIGSAGFSLLALVSAVVTIAGDCEYPAKNLELYPLSGHGVSNKAFGTVTITASAPVILCFE